MPAGSRFPAAASAAVETIPIAAYAVKATIAYIRVMTGKTPYDLFQALNEEACKADPSLSLPSVVHQLRHRAQGDSTTWDPKFLLTLAMLARKMNGNVKAMVEGLSAALESDEHGDWTFLHPLQFLQAAQEESRKEGYEQGRKEAEEKYSDMLFFAQADSDERTLMMYWSKKHPDNPECQSFAALRQWLDVHAHRQAVQDAVDERNDRWEDNFDPKASDRRNKRNFFASFGPVTPSTSTKNTKSSSAPAAKADRKRKRATSEEGDSLEHDEVQAKKKPHKS